MIGENQANPARWKGHLSHLLPKRKKLSRGHHEAMPCHDVPAFVARLRERQAVAALALEFTILTAARTKETLGARWEEIDASAAVWIVPANRMKSQREHRVALSARAVEVLELARPLCQGSCIFPSARGDRPLSMMSMEMLLRRLKVKPYTVHGFRSSFRDWVGECTSFPGDLAEAALAHLVGDAVERAYRRGDALERRRELMEAWGRFLSEPAEGSVIAITMTAARR